MEDEPILKKIFKGLRGTHGEGEGVETILRKIYKVWRGQIHGGWFYCTRKTKFIP